MLRTAERVQLPRPRQSRIDLDQRMQLESNVMNHNRSASRSGEIHPDWIHRNAGDPAETASRTTRPFAHCSPPRDDLNGGSQQIGVAFPNLNHIFSMPFWYRGTHGSYQLRG